jgi:hypothetical protein
MNNVFVTFTPSVYLTLTADQWALYHIPGRDEAAQGLNRDVAQAINNALGPHDAHQGCERALDRYREYGAADTEGYNVMYSVMQLAYPHQE